MMEKFKVEFEQVGLKMNKQNTKLMMNQENNRCIILCEEIIKRDPRIYVYIQDVSRKCVQNLRVGKIIQTMTNKV